MRYIFLAELIRVRKKIKTYWGSKRRRMSGSNNVDSGLRMNPVPTIHKSGTFGG